MCIPFSIISMGQCLSKKQQYVTYFILHTTHTQKSPTQLDTDLLLHVTQVAVKYSSGGGSADSPARNMSPANT